MRSGKSLSQPIGRLERREQKYDGAEDGVWEQPSLKGRVVLPGRMRRVDQKAFIVIEHIDARNSNH